MAGVILQTHSVILQTFVIWLALLFRRLLFGWRYFAIRNCDFAIKCYFAIKPLIVSKAATNSLIIK
jgi:hypothetical protein